MKENYHHRSSHSFPLIARTFSSSCGGDSIDGEKENDPSQIWRKTRNYRHSLDYQPLKGQGGGEGRRRRLHRSNGSSVFKMFQSRKNALNSGGGGGGGGGREGGVRRGLAIFSPGVSQQQHQQQHREEKTKRHPEDGVGSSGDGDDASRKLEPLRQRTKDVSKEIKNDSIHRTRTTTTTSIPKRDHLHVATQSSTDEEEETLPPHFHQQQEQHQQHNQQAFLPRIDDSMTLKELGEEALYRDMLSHSTCLDSKSNLLELLVPGSIRLSATKVAQDYQDLLARLESEKPQLRREQQEQRRKRLLQQERAQQIKRSHRQRAIEQQNQTLLHTYSFPNVHPHPKAPSERLNYFGQPRGQVATCQWCQWKDDQDERWESSSSGGGDGEIHQGDRDALRHKVLWTCEPCNFDICQECFQPTNLPHPQFRSEPTSQRNVAQQQQPPAPYVVPNATKPSQGSGSSRGSSTGYRWDPPGRFEKHIVFPSYQNTNPPPTQNHHGSGYTVWCSYDGPTISRTTTSITSSCSSNSSPEVGSNSKTPKQEFDTTWDTFDDAQARARYLYHWKNCWRSSSHQSEEDVYRVRWDQRSEEPDQPKYGQPFGTWPQRSCWRVGLVTNQEFAHLPHATRRRHTFDLNPTVKGGRVVVVAVVMVRFIKATVMHFVTRSFGRVNRAILIFVKSVSNRRIFPILNFGRNRQVNGTLHSSSSRRRRTWYQMPQNPHRAVAAVVVVVLVIDGIHRAGSKSTLSSRRTKTPILLPPKTITAVDIPFGVPMMVRLFRVLLLVLLAPAAATAALR